MVMTENDTDAFAPVDDAPKRGRGRPPKDKSVTPDDKAPKRPTTPNPVKGWSRAVEIENILYKYFQGLSLGISFLNAADGEIFSQGAASLAHELVELGKVDKRMRSILESMAAPGKYGGLLIASGSIIIPIAMNHNLIPQLDLGLLTKNAVKPDQREGDS